MFDIDKEYKNLTDYFTLNFSPSFTNFHKSFHENATTNNFQFEFKSVNDYSGANLEERNITTENELMFFDTEKQIHLGRGGFNPFNPIDLNRISSGFTTASQKNVDLFKSVSKAMAKNDVDYLIENNILDSDRLKNLDIGDLKYYHKAVSIFQKSPGR